MTIKALVDSLCLNDTTGILVNSICCLEKQNGAIDDFYRVTHFFSVIITILILLYIWFRYLNIREILNLDEETDYGLVLLSLALFVWGIMAFCKYIDIELSKITSVILSTINNCLFLSSFPFFEHGFKFLQKKRQRYYWFLVILIIGILSLITALILFHIFPSKEDQWIGFTVDLLVTTITLLALGKLLFNSFNARGFNGIGYISLIFIFMLITASVTLTWTSYDPKLGTLDEILFLTSSFGLSSIFIALTFSWINEMYSKTFLNIFVTSNDDFQEEIEEGSIEKEELKQTIINNLSSDKLEESIEELLVYFRKNKIYKGINDIIPIAANLSRLNTSKVRGIIDEEKYNRARNKINVSILGVTNIYL